MLQKFELHPRWGAPTPPGSARRREVSGPPLRLPVQGDHLDPARGRRIDDGGQGGAFSAAVIDWLDLNTTGLDLDLQAFASGPGDIRPPSRRGAGLDRLAHARGGCEPAGTDTANGKRWITQLACAGADDDKVRDDCLKRLLTIRSR